MGLKDWFLQFFAPTTRGVVNVGFDFGTHSTKIVIRERDATNGRIVRIDKDHGDYTPGVSPSVIRIVNNRLWFGTTALTSTGGELLKSLKVAVACELPTPVAKTTDISNAKLVALYMAWTLQNLRRTIQKERYSRILLNVSAPMQRIENAKLKNQYLRIVQSAWLLSAAPRAETIEQGIAVSKALDLLNAVWTRPVEPEQQREFDILPETIAPVCSFSTDPAAEAGIHVIIDIGAGSTEVSVLDVPEHGSGFRVLCYHDESRMFGGNDLELACRTDHPSHRVSEIHQKLATLYAYVWQMGYAKIKNEKAARPRWMSLKLVLSGGGTLDPEVRARLEAENVINAWPEEETKRKVYRHVPNTLTPLPEMKKSDLSIFAVANGLAVDRAKFTSFDPPDSIPPMQAPPPEEKTIEYWDDRSN